MGRDLLWRAAADKSHNNCMNCLLLVAVRKDENISHCCDGMGCSHGRYMAHQCAPVDDYDEMD